MRILQIRQLEQLVKEHVPEGEQRQLLELLSEVRSAHELEMLPPEWDDIDRQYEWLGMDNKGCWYVCTDKPMENSTGYQRLTGDMLFIREPATRLWRMTLQQRHKEHTV